MEVGGQRHVLVALPPGKRPGTHCTGGLVVWTGAENLTPTRIRSLDRPARSELLYRLRYHGPRSPTHVGGIKKLCPYVCYMCTDWFLRKYKLIARDE
jgi:hypothetical protein